MLASITLKGRIHSFKMARASSHRVFLFVLLGIAELEIFSKAENQTWTCQDHWISFESKDEVFCLLPRSGKTTIQGAHLDCIAIDAQTSLMSIHSEEKDNFILGLMSQRNIDAMLIGLTTIQEVGYEELRWLRRDGNEMVDYRNFRSGPNFDGSHLCTWKLRGHGMWTAQTCNSYTRYPYICEQRPQCDVGTFGARCEKQCHCHGEPCDPRGLTVSCPFGCERGWMGIGCDKRKEDADVTYYCVNSKDHGTYVSIMIDTKGVEYRNIHGLDAQGKPAPWCNDTALIIGRPKDFIDIKIFKTKANQECLTAGVCAGKIIDENTMLWILVIQERKGILMDNDQSLLITCNFSDAETLTRDGHEDVQETNETPLHILQETHERVKLEVADAFTGEVLTQTKTGSPVRLQMRFGLQEGSLVKGVVPYNCDAVSGDGKQRQPLLDKFGCQESDLVSSFHKSNLSHVIQTDWFPFFGFEGSSVVQLRCSFTFCFVDCETGCDHFAQNSTHSGHRSRRDTRDLHHSVVRRIEILPLVVGEAEGHRISMKPIAAVPTDEERPTETETVTESEASYPMQWASYNWFFLFSTAIIVIVILIVYIISMWTVHSSFKSIKQEIKKSTIYREDLLRVACSD